MSKMDKFKINDIKKMQWRNLALMIAVILVGLWVLYSLLTIQSSKTTSAKTKVHFTSPLQHIDAESIILEKTQKQLLEAEKKTESLQQQLQNFIRSKQQDDRINQNTHSQYQQISNRLNMLEKQLLIPNQADRNFRSAGAASPNSMEIMNRVLPLPRQVHGADAAAMHSGQSPMINGIHEDQLSLTTMHAAKQLKPLLNPDTYVPAGTFVRAVLLGGADASAAVNAQSNPTPLLLRLIADGTLPNRKRSHLKDCVVTAAVVGDISSERGAIRLENISCVRSNNEIVDQPVQGTVFGPEGKNGVRGIPVWRESALLQRAFFAGALSGIADGVSQRYTTTSLSPLGATQTVDNSAIAQYGAARGVSNAMNKLADYNIKRAEQYHPVIQLSAGTVVDVVFLKGFYLHNPQTVSAATNSLTFSSSQNANSLSLSAAQIERLKEKSKEIGL